MLDDEQLKGIARGSSAWGDQRWKQLADCRQRGLSLRDAADVLGCASVTVSRRWRQVRLACVRKGHNDPGAWDALRRSTVFDISLSEVDQ